MAIPTLDSSAAAIAGVGTSLEVPFPGTVNSGDLLLLVYGVSKSAGATTPTGWTRERTASESDCTAELYSKIASGSESGNLTFTVDTNNDPKIARIFRSTDADSVEALGSSSAKTKTIDHADIVSTGADRLAMTITAINDNEPALSFTGESNGDLTLLTDDVTELGSDHALSVQTADLASAVTLSGGTWAYSGATEDWVTVGFAIFNSSGPQALTPSFVTTEEAFFAPTVTPGAVTLTPGLLVSEEAFFAPTVTATYSLTPGLSAAEETFFAPTVTTGSVTLTPSFVTTEETFFAPTVAGGAVNLTPGLSASEETFFAPTVAPGSVTLTPSLSASEEAFFAPTVAAGAVALTPGLSATEEAFFAPTVTLVGGTQDLTPGLSATEEAFFAPTVTPGAVALTPGLSATEEAFFAPTVALVGGTQDLTPSLVATEETFFGPTVAATYALTPGFLASEVTFYPAVVTGGSVLANNQAANSNANYRHTRFAKVGLRR